MALRLPGLIQSRTRPSGLLSDADWAEVAALLRRAASSAMAMALRPDSGDGPSRLRGRGLDYVESRGYQPGDDLRSMHWALLARTGRPHVKVHEEEHAGSWHGLVDLRGPMRFGTRGRTKAAQAARTVLLDAGAQALAAPGLRLAATLWRDDGVHTRRLGRGTAAVRRLAAWMQAQDLPSPGPRGGDDGLLAWSQLLGAEPPSRLVVASDFDWFGGRAEAALCRAAAQSALLALRVRDPVELALPALGAAWFEPLAGGACAWVDTAAAGAGYAAAAAQRAAAAAAALRRCRGVLVELTTPQPADALLRELLAARGRT